MNAGRRSTGWIAVALLVGATMAGAGEPVVRLGDARSVSSRALDREMTLVVHLPEGYAAGGERYPVLYMLGSDYRARFALAAATLDSMRDGGQIPATILVGIDLPEGNGVLIPREGEDGTASADRHLAFLCDEVVPHVDGAFRTASYRLLYGASNSGLFVVYALLSRPEAFDAYLASSPMIGWSADLMAERARSLPGDRELRRRFLHVIHSDDDYGRVTEAVPPFLALLQGRRVTWLETRSEVRANEGHVPVVDLPMALKAAFPDYNPATELATLEALTGHFAGLSERYGFTIPTPAGMVFDLGMEHLQARRLDEALAVFRHAIAAYPKHSRGYVGVGLVHRLRGETEKAREWLQKALEVDPEDGVAKRQLERLDGES